MIATNKKLYGPNNKVLEVAGQVTCQLKCRKGIVSQPVFVVDSLVRPLLGLPAVEALQLVERVDELQSPGEMFRQKFPAVFTGLGRIEGDYTIRLKDDAMPYALNTPRRVPFPLAGKVKEEV